MKADNNQMVGRGGQVICKDFLPGKVVEMQDSQLGGLGLGRSFSDASLMGQLAQLNASNRFQTSPDRISVKKFLSERLENSERSLDLQKIENQF